jgi:Icc protein
MGHTHYNELANDGRTVFMATRSTGQMEEGHVGYSVAAIDAGVVSWRFAPLHENGPLVLVTCPSDHRLIIDPNSAHQVVREMLTVRAKVWSASGIDRVCARVDGGEPIALARDPTDPSLWQASKDVGALSEGLHALTVDATDVADSSRRDTITFTVGRYALPPRIADGSDRNAVGGWPEKGILGTQLGPNRNGRKC